MKNLVKHRQERQNSRFELLREVRERCKTSKKIALKPVFFFTSIFKGFLSQLGWIWGSKLGFQKHIPDDFFSYSCPRALQERPKSAQERSKSAPRALQEHPRAPQERPKSPRSAPRAPKSTPRAEKYAKTRKNVRKLIKTCKKRTKTHKNYPKR